MNNGWSGEDIRVILAVFGGGAVTALYFVRTALRSRRRAERREEAIKNKRVIKAQRVKYSVIRGAERGESDDYHGVYEYEVDGRKKKYSITAHYDIPLVLHLYYDKSPEQVFSDYDKSRLGYSVGILLGIAAVILILFLTGYIGLGPFHI